MRFRPNGLACRIIFSLWFSGRLWIHHFHFHQTIRHPFVANTWPSPYQERPPAWSPPTLRSDMFSKCSFFLSSVLFSILFLPLITYEPLPFWNAIFLLLGLLNFCFLCFFVLVVHGYAEKVQKRQQTTSSDMSQSVLVIWCKQKKMKSTHLYLCPDFKKRKKMEQNKVSVRIWICLNCAATCCVLLPHRKWLYCAAVLLLRDHLICFFIYCVHHVWASER